MKISTSKPLIRVKNKAQKGRYRFSDILSKAVLSDVCMRLFGSPDYEETFDDIGYNKGRLATITYGDSITYVSFSEHGKVDGRNSFFQSLTTAFTAYCSELRPNKRIAFYFLPTISGNFKGDYFRFMYRLMATNGVEFLNAERFLSTTIHSFVSLDDIVATRALNRGQNSTNNSTYITRGEKHTAQIYAKTYGASKKEATLLCLAAAKLSDNVELFEICEQDLSQLPAPDLEAIKRMGNVTVIPTSRTMERLEFGKDANYRSPRFIYNLFQKFQHKECAFCECRIPEIIAGAHIWAVAGIKRSLLSEEEKLRCATDGDNGLWLCHNHHKMFDENLVTITDSGRIVYDNGLNEVYESFIRKITTKDALLSSVFTADFAQYLDRRSEEAKV
jgi:hypothetical protein